MALELVNKLPYDHPYRWDGTLFGGQKLWRPSELGADLALWLDAEDTDSITLNGSNVSQWSDKSGNNRNVSQATASAQPVYNSTAYNGKPVLQLNGTSHFLDAGVVSMQSTGLNVFVVGDYSDTNYFMGEYDSASNQREWLVKSDSYLIQENLSPFDGTMAANGANQSGKHLLEFIFTNGQPAEFWADGSIKGTAATAVNSIEQGTAPLQIGKYQTVYSNSDISEVVITGAALSDANRQKLEGYLAWKWGLTADLPAGHPYKTTPPIVGGAPAPLAADYGTGAAAAYSLRYVSNNYSGPVIRVREDSGNTEQDFTPVQITDGTLEAFVGAGNNGFVTTWYDQSGNGKNASQTTAGSQPAIVSSGSLIVENGKPAILFDGGNDSLETSGYIVELSQNNVTLFATGRFAGPYDLVEADNLLSYSSNFILSGTTSGSVILWVNTAEFGTRDRLVQSSMGFIYDGVNFQAYTNGALSGVSGPATINPEVGDKTVIGARADFSAGFSSSAFQELIIYHSDESVNRLAIDFDINTHYGIY